MKPVTETRMFEKLGTSLATIPEVNVHIIGFPSSGYASGQHRIELHPHSAKPFGRLSLTRMAIPSRIMFKVLSLKPDLLIITTHELLWMALWCKLVLGCRVVYDVQENYFRNILYTKTFPLVVRPLLACYVRFKEWICKPVVDVYLLAEKGYGQELRFARPFLVLENKLPERQAHRYRRSAAGNSNLIFSGTLSETTGVLEAINLAGNLHRLNPDITLTIIGNCLSENFLNKLKQQASTHSFIRFTGSIYPVEHEQILEAINRAVAGIIIYPANPSTACSVPTKLYEYLGLGLPVIIRHNEDSHKLVEALQAGIVLQPGHKPERILTWLQQPITFIPPPEIYWESAETELLTCVQELLP